MKNTKLHKIMIKGTISLYEALINEKLKYNDKTNSVVYKKTHQVVTEKLRLRILQDITEVCDDLLKISNSTVH